MKVHLPTARDAFIKRYDVKPEDDLEKWLDYTAGWYDASKLWRETIKAAIKRSRWGAVIRLMARKDF